MKHRTTLATFCWLLGDTFRQSLSSGIFVVLLAISVVSIAVCASVTVHGPLTLDKGDGPDFLSRREAEAADATKLKTSGVSVADGRLALAFGAIDVPLARDTKGGVQFLQLVLAGGVADTLGLMLSLIWTAGFLPGFLEGRNICVLLAKPAPRRVLILGKYFGVLGFVLVNAVVFVLGTWTAIGLRTGYWDAAYLLCIPLLLLHFSVFFGFSVLLAVWTGNPVVCVFGSIVFWCVAWSMNFARHALATSTDLVAETIRSSHFHALVELGYWLLPKPADLSMLLFDSLGARSHFGALLDPATLEAQDFSMTLSVLSSLAFAACVLLASVRKFQATDY
jgi:hypothetical protein